MITQDDLKSAISGFRKRNEGFKSAAFFSPYKDAFVMVNKATMDFVDPLVDRYATYPPIFLEALYEVMKRLHYLSGAVAGSESPPFIYAVAEDMLQKFDLRSKYLILNGSDHSIIPYSYLLSRIFSKSIPDLNRLAEKFKKKEAQVFFVYFSSDALDYPTRWPVLYHEISHMIDYLQGFSEKRYPEEEIAPEHKTEYAYAKSYYKECFADILATHFFKPFFGRTLCEYPSFRAWDESDPHPPPHERAIFIGEELTSLGFTEEGNHLREYGEQLKTELFPGGCIHIIPQEVKDGVREDIRELKIPDMPRRAEIEQASKNTKEEIPSPDVDPRTILIMAMEAEDPKKFCKVFETSLDMYLFESLNL